MNTIKKTRLTASLAMMTLPSLLLPDAHAGVEWAIYNGPSDYWYSLKAMPDFDQVRSQGDPDLIGFPNNGNMFCVPTSSANALAYIATHGFPEYEPGQKNWSLKSNYNDSGEVILDLADEMDTNPATGSQMTAAHDALDLRLNDKFTVTHTWSSFDFKASTDLMVQDAINDGIIVPYYYFGNMGTNFHGQKTVDFSGGHCVTLSYAYADDNGVTIGVRDPGQHEGDLFAQSDFVTRMWPITTEQVFINNLPWELDRLGNSTNFNRYLAGWITIRPKCAYSWEPYDNGFKQYREDGPLGSQLDFNKDITLATHDEVIDLAPGPLQIKSWILVRQQTFYKLFPISNHDGAIDPSPIDNLVRPSALAFDRHHNFHVVDAEGVKGYRSSDQEPIGAIPLPSPAPRLVVDDRTDLMVMVLPASGHLATMPVDYSQAPLLNRLPAQVNLSNEVEMAISPLDSTIFLMDVGNQRTWAVSEDRGELTAELVTFSGAENPTDIQVDDGGEVLIADRGVIKAYKKDGGAWRTSTGNSRHGSPTASRFKITRNSSNRTDDSIDVPNLPESGEGATDLVDCQADVNWDRNVDIEDLLIVLEAWDTTGGSAGDITNNQVVDVEDLLLVVSGWGNCAN